MKLVLIFIIGALLSLQFSEARSNKWTQVPVFNSHAIFNLINAVEEAATDVFSNTANWTSGSLDGVTDYLLNTSNSLYSVISSQAQQTIENLQDVRKNVENMTETLSLEKMLSIDYIKICLNNSTYMNKKAVIDTAKNTARSCITGQYHDGHQLLKSLLDNFVDYVNSNVNLPREDSCNTLQKGYFDVFGTINKRNCLEKVRRMVIRESERRFSFVRNTVIDIAESVKYYEQAMLECTKIGSTAISDLKKEILDNC